MSANISEIWKPVVGYEGLYEVSDHGRLRGLQRMDRYGRIIRSRMMALTRNKKNKYVYAMLSANGVRSNRLLHRMVLDAFVGPCPEGMEACHNNGDHGDNRLPNLRWDAHMANCADRAKHGHDMDGEKSASARLKRADVIEIYRLRNEGHTHRRIALKFDVATDHVRNILRGKRWRSARGEALA